MLYTIITTANANRDIQRAINWENKRKPGLAARFLKDLDQKFEAISLTPHLGSIRYANVHCIPTNIFSYLIHYTVVQSKQQIIILRVLHTSRKPIW